MDGSHFDALSRALAAGQSRRGLTGLLAGLALTGPLALLEPTETEAKRKKRKKKRRRGGSALPPGCTPQCTGKTCGDNGCGGSCGGCAITQVCDAAGLCCTPDCTGQQCGTDGCGGTCGTCGAGLTCCGETCVDLAIDENHCGVCGRVCANGCEHEACECTNGANLCPGTGCGCVARIEGAPPVCFASVSATLCDADSDCPVGTNCLVNGRCSGPCL